MSCWSSLNLCVFLDGCDDLRPAGPSTLPGAGPGWAARSAAALHPHICGSSTQTSETSPFRGLPEIHRGAQCWVHYCQQMGPNALWWVRCQIYVMLVVDLHAFFFFHDQYKCDPLCKNQPKVQKSNSEISSIKAWLKALIVLWFQSFTWPYSVNIKETNNWWFYAENSQSQKKDFSWVFTERVTNT